MSEGVVTVVYRKDKRSTITDQNKGLVGASIADAWHEYASRWSIPGNCVVVLIRDETVHHVTFFYELNAGDRLEFREM